MSDPSLGTWLRKERERRGITLKTISDQTKVAVPLLEGLEADNLARWPEGIYRRAFVRAYATTVGLDCDEVARRFEQEHGGNVETPEDTAGATAAAVSNAPPVAPVPSSPVPSAAPDWRLLSRRSRVLGTLADLTVALVLALASAAAGSRLLWPVLLIAAYYALGVLLSGTSPMVALLHDEPAALPARDAEPADSSAVRPGVERRHQSRRNPTRAVRSSRAPRPRVQ
jgi:transcriptional regulator with XRE-family HTH domain